MLFRELMMNVCDSINEMAFERKLVINRIRGLENQINEHLIKILMFDDEINFNKHFNDIENWLYQIQDFDVNKKGNKLKEKDYFKLLFVEPISDNTNVNYVNKKLKRSLKKYSTLKHIRTSSEVVYDMYQIHKIIANALSNDEIEDKMNNLKNIIH